MNPVEPPVTLRNTLWCVLPRNADQGAVAAAVGAATAALTVRVPGLLSVVEPRFDTSEGDQLVLSTVLEAVPDAAEVMTSTAVAVAGRLALTRQVAAS